MSIEMVEDLYTDRILKLLDAEQMQEKALPRFAEKVNSEALKKLLLSHAEETKVQIQRLEELVEDLQSEPRQAESRVMRALIAEGMEFVDASLEPDLFDAAMVMLLSSAESHEISCYSSALRAAKLLGHKEDSGLLSRSLKEEKAMDDRLFSMADVIIRDAAESEEIIQD